MARVEVMLPTWSARPLLARPTLPALRLPAGWQRARRHVVVALISMLAGIVLWLPGGFDLGLGIRMAIGVFTGIGLAAVATALSLSVSRR